MKGKNNIKAIIILILLLIIPNLVLAENVENVKSEKYNFTINAIDEGKGDNAINIKELEKVLNDIYKKFEDLGIKLFQEGMTYNITKNVTNTETANSTPYSINYYSPKKIKWNYELIYNITLHEIGHTISYKKMDQKDWKEYQKLRGINFEDYQKINKREEKKGKYTETQVDYLLCSQENFAEDFRYILINKNVKKLKQQTLWGEIKNHKNKKEIEKFLISVLKNDKNFDMFEDEECVYGRYNPLALTLNNEEVK